MTLYVRILVQRGEQKDRNIEMKRLRFSRSEIMTVEATGSKFTRNNRFYLTALCLAGALWFGYDGWFGSYRDKELESNDGKPTASLLFNQYSPIPLTLIALCSLYFGFRITSKKIEADEEGLVLSGGEKIPYRTMKKIDKRRFKNKGLFSIAYETDTGEKTLKLTDRQYDNLGKLLDEIVRQTGARPENEIAQEEG